MPHIEIFREPVYRTYRSSECSWAAFYIKSINIFRYFLPILIIFLTDTALYQKPNRNLNIQFQMSTQNLSINTVIYAFSLKMKLDYHSIIDSELFLTDTIQFPSFPTSQIQTTARLTVDQSVPFQSREKFSIIDRRRQDVEHYQIHSVLRRISESPISWKMERKSSILLSAPSPPPTLSLSIFLSISEMEFTYRTGFWELMKWFWIQYFAVFYIIDYLFTSITSYLFRNHVFYVNDVVR
ncbi:hypothetical protein GCK72_015136 [Caenorhabditis remanei]|uniref:Transmembrane protein 231 n=1 Tax=Caenorhabditis remanei TaxID=31234 RepID=A0A6A5GTZ9_CAERE|nr:hypothetical protein GCK72_015136 [Caenorhabditis remanei]KAF1758677.1 hypothetical protein GCK72_015136 [Caenorhabditis remanei]